VDEANAAMLAQLRSTGPEPYAERRPVPRVVQVVGRRTGRPRPFAVNVTQLDGHLYACSATRERDWVRNLVAAGRCRIERDAPGGADSERRPVLVSGREAATVLATYLPQAGYRDTALPFAIDAPLEEMERLAHLTAVVRFDRVAR
jgi:deazaflavin-dependent oxidoreductase (nitroreductase family)